MASRMCLEPPLEFDFARFAVFLLNAGELGRGWVI